MKQPALLSFIDWLRREGYAYTHDTREQTVSLVGHEDQNDGKPFAPTAYQAYCLEWHRIEQSETQAKHLRRVK